MPVPTRHPGCGQFLGPRPHVCPGSALTCVRGHFREENGYVKADGWQRCRACDRMRRDRPTAYFGTHCVRGHRKTAATWKYISDGFRCMRCRRINAERRRRAA